MKLAILLARSSDDRTHASVVGSPMPYDQAAAIFKDHVARGEMPNGCAAAGFNQLELWTSSGTAKKKKFSVPVKPTGAPLIQPQNDEGDQGAVDADPQGGTPAAAPPTGQNPAIDPRATAASAKSGGDTGDGKSAGDPVTKMAARLSAQENVTPEDLAALTVPQLKALAAGFAIEIPGDALKDDIITLILASD